MGGKGLKERSKNFFVGAKTVKGQGWRRRALGEAAGDDGEERRRG